MKNLQELVTYSKDLTLLFAEDHDELRESTVDILKNFFSHVDSAADGQEALELFQKKEYDIVLTDIRMPYLDGIELVIAIYEHKPKQPIVILSAHDESEYLIPLINLGVSQFIKKPIDYQELINALLRIAKDIHTKDLPQDESALTRINFEDDYYYEREKKMLLHKESTVYLTKYEILFLDLLTSQKGRIFSNDDIVAYYQQYNENIDAQNIRKLVSKLRKKLPKNSIESIYGVGYRVLAQN